jgi:Tol biopolymer transport system component
MEDRMRSFLEVYDLASGKTRLVLASDRRIEAPNWHPDGWLLVNGDGRLFRVPLDAPDLHTLDTGFAVRCNNDHGFSPDGTRIILSSHTDRGSEIFTMPVSGGTPEPVTRNAPSWWHGWSPDGARIVYAAARGGRVVDIWSCPASGGEERRLTFGEGHSDGPDYASDGTWVYYNCDRTGRAQIWRMRPDGTGHEQVFADSFVNWFPHPSPDGQHVLYLAYPQGTEGHPRDRDVALVLMDPDGGNRRTVAAFNGGQGSINVPCWASDGTAFAFVRYAAPETA